LTFVKKLVMEGKGINTKISKKEEEENDLRPILIGITGGTASGKTTVCQYLL
jgi:uridine kinase